MPGSVLVGPTTQEYGYDDLYQLISASGTYQDRRDWQYRYRLSFAYDEIGNILTKDQASYRYVPQACPTPVPAGCDGWREDHAIREQTYRSEYRYPGPQPHAPKRIEEHLVAESMPWPREMRYDASGNQTGWTYRGSDTRATDWNEENRVRRVSQNGQVLSRMLYDGDGERRVHLHHVSGEEETAYHDQHLTLRDGRFVTKHIYAGQTRIASKMDPDWFRDPPTLYYHPDHLGSTSFASNNEQTLTQRDEYFPSGELWIDASDSRYELQASVRVHGEGARPGDGALLLRGAVLRPAEQCVAEPGSDPGRVHGGRDERRGVQPGEPGAVQLHAEQPGEPRRPGWAAARKGRHRNFPPGANGCRHPSCFNGPEGGKFHQEQMLQRMNAGSAAAAGRTSRGIGDGMRRLLFRAVMQQQQAARPPAQPAAAPAQPPQAAPPAQATQPAKGPQPAATAKPPQAGLSARRGTDAKAGPQVARRTQRRAVGKAREDAAAKLTEGSVSGERIEAPSLGHTDVDVVAKNGDLVMVGESPRKVRICILWAA